MIKKDLARVKEELDLVNSEVSFELNKAREDFAADLRQVNQTMKSELTRVQTQVAQSEQKVLKELKKVLDIVKLKM